MDQGKEAIWYRDLAGAFAADNYFVVMPLRHMTIEQKLNAVVRFFLYMSVLLLLITGDPRYVFFGIAASIASVAIYEYQERSRNVAEHFLQKQDLDIVDNRVCVRSTLENPFMNPTLVDLADHPGRPPACYTGNAEVQATVDKNFHTRLFQDVGDLYGKQASQRQFYTVPSTTIPNDRDTFAKWLYGRGPTCKEGDGTQCYQNIFTVRTT